MIFTDEFMEPIFIFLEGTMGVPQSLKHHPEGDVFTHSLQVMHQALRETDDTDLILAAMLHDVGKAGLPLDKRSGHETVGAEWLRDYVSPKTIWLIEQHMRVWAYLKGEMKRLGKCLYLANHPWLPELVQLARWDKMGRRPGWYPMYNRRVIQSSLNTKGMARFEGLKEEDPAEAAVYLWMLSETGMRSMEAR